MLTDSFVPLRALSFWLRIEVVDPCFILNNEFWNKFCWVTSVSFEKFFRNLCAVLLLAFSTPVWQTLCSYAKIHKIFIAQKPYRACETIGLATTIGKFNLLWTELGQAENFLITTCTHEYVHAVSRRLHQCRISLLVCSWSTIVDYFVNNQHRQIRRDKSRYWLITRPNENFIS